MQIKKYYVRKTTHSGPKVAHTIIEFKNGTQKLLCNPNAIYQKGTLTEKPLDQCVRECDRCIVATSEEVTNILKNGRQQEDENGAKVWGHAHLK